MNGSRNDLLNLQCKLQCILENNGFLKLAVKITSPTRSETKKLGSSLLKMVNQSLIKLRK